MDVVAYSLFQKVLENDVDGIETILKTGSVETWTKIACYEFKIEFLSGKGLKDSPIALKLMGFEIESISSFHFSCLCGHDMMLPFLEKGIPVDTPLSSGTMPLHLGAYAGSLETVNLLLNVYNADVNAKDNYGWTALHFSCAEGNLDITKALVENGIDFNARDKDGTTAAFRAQANKHMDLVAFLCTLGEEDDLLNVDEEGTDENMNGKRRSVSGVGKRPVSRYSFAGKTPIYEEPIYAQVNKGKRNKSDSAPVADDDYTFVIDNVIYDSPGNCKNNQGNGLLRANSVPAATPAASTSVQMRAGTLPSKPSKHRNSTIRRMIQRELESTFEDDYEEPLEVIGRERKQDTEQEVNDALSKLGMMTLKGIMREELDKYRHQMLKKITEERYLPPPPQGEDNSDDDDAYATLASYGVLPPAPPTPTADIPPPGAPPLPSRNSSNAFEDDASDPLVTGSLQLRRQSVSRGFLDECFDKIATRLGPKWKTLARALPMDPTANVNDQILAIESQYTRDVTKQAKTALTIWKKNLGDEANIDELILGLRRAGCHDIIGDMETEMQEFSV